MSSPVSPELAAAQEAWRLRKKREEKESKERELQQRFFQDNDVETDDEEEFTVFVPFEPSDDAEKLAVYKDFTLALIDRGFLFKHLYFTNKSTTREMRGAIYKKSKRSSREKGAGPSGAKKAEN